MTDWKPKEFNWRYVLSSPNFSPNLAFIWFIGVGFGLLMGWAMPWAIIVLGLAALVVVVEWCLAVYSSAKRERARVRSARNYYD